MTQLPSFGHIIDIDWSPDSTRMVINSDEGTLRVIDTTTGEVLLTYDEHQAEVKQVVWAPDGERIASLNKRNPFDDIEAILNVWDPATGETLYQTNRTGILPREGSLDYFAWSPDGNQIAVAAETLAIIFDARTGEVTGELVPKVSRDTGYPEARIDNIAWFDSGEQIATVSSRVAIWDIETGELTHQDSDPDTFHSTPWATDIDILDDAGLVLTGGNRNQDGQIILWDQQANISHVLPTGDRRNRVEQVVASEDATFIMTMSTSGTLTTWSKTTLEGTPFAAHSGRVGSVEWSPDGTQFAATVGSQILMYEGEQVVARYQAIRDGLLDVTWSSDGAYLVTHTNAFIYTFAVGQSEPLANERGLGGTMREVTWSPNRNLIISLFADRLAMWQAPDLLPLFDIGLEDGVTDWEMDWSPLGDNILVIQPEEVLLIRTAQGGGIVSPPIDTSYRFRNGVFSSDGSQVALIVETPEDEVLITIWNVVTWDQTLQIDATESDPDQIDWSPDGQFFATSSSLNADNLTLTVWAVSTGEQNHVFASGQVGSLDWHPNSDRILTASDDGIITIWETDN